MGQADQGAVPLDWQEPRDSLASLEIKDFPGGLVHMEQMVFVGPPG